MIVRNDNNKLNRVNQADIVNVNKRPIGSNILKLFLILALSISFAFILISFSSESVVAISQIEDETQKKYASDPLKLYGTQGSGRVLWEKNIARATGVGRIIDDTAQGKLDGRQVALVDAKRNLLILRQKLLNDPQLSEKDTKGYNETEKTAKLEIHSERVKNNLYFLYVDIPLSKLMAGDIDIE